MRFENYESWFRIATGHEAPRKWQAELASDAAVRNRLIRIPTGMGKTLGVLLAWAYHRLQRNDKQWPARLVWFSAIRTLIEQDQLKATETVDRLLHGTRYFVYVAMVQHFEHTQPPSHLGRNSLVARVHFDGKRGDSIVPQGQIGHVESKRRETLNAGESRNNRLQLPFWQNQLTCEQSVTTLGKKRWW